MPFTRPSPQDILDRVQAEIDVALPGADARLRRSVEHVLARVVTMTAHELYGYLDYISRQILVSTADEDNLERHSAIWGIPRKNATPAQGSIQFSGINGSVVPQGTLLKRPDDVQFVLAADVVIAGGVGIGAVTSIISGLNTNTSIGSKLNLLSPIAGIQSETIVIDEGIIGGTDIEVDTSLRARIIKRIQEPPHGGAFNDYIAWALSMPGVTRAWAYPEQYGDGTVGVTFVMDEKVGGIIPSLLEVADVQSYIDSVRPVTAEVTVFAPTPTPIDFVINLSPNNISIQNSVKAELEDLFLREAKPGGILYASRIREAISTAVGEFDHILISPNANIISTFGNIPVIGNYTFGGI